MRELNTSINQLSYNIIGAAIEVHRSLEPGLLENVYEQALYIELQERNIQFEQQKEIGLTYKGRPIGTGRIDILVDDCIVIELKAVERLLPIHTAQVMTYLKIAEKRLGLLINFNTDVLTNGVKRIIL